MSDASLATFGFDVNTTGLRAGSDELTRLEQRTNAATEALARLEARAATAMSRVSASMGGTAPAASGPAGSPAAASQAASAAQQALSAATTTATGTIAAQATALNTVTAAHKAHGASMGNSTLAALELAHVSRALFDTWASGGSVMRGLLMEGGRLQIMLGASGGLSGLFELVTSKAGELGSKALGLANPVTLGATAVVGFGAAALNAASNVRSLREEMGRALSGVGHFSGLSSTGLEALARGGASANGLPLDAARSAAERLAATGRLDASGISGGLGLVRGYAATFGTSYDEAGGKLADIFRDPVHGADQLNERLGFLTDATRKYIQALRDQGDASGAARALMAASAVPLNEQIRPKGFADTIGEWFRRRSDEVDHALARDTGMLPFDPMEAYRRTGAISALQSGISRFVPTPRDAPYDPSADPSNYAEDIRNAGRLRALQEDRVASSRLSLEAGNAIGRITPDAGRYFDLQNQAKLLRDTMASPSAVAGIAPGMSDGKLLSGADLLAESLGKVNDRLANWMGSVEKSTLAVNANVMGINAWTLGEHLAAATAQEMASLGIRQIRSAEDLIAVQGRQAEVIARANDKAYNLARDAADDLSLAGKSGLDRTLAEIRLKSRDYGDQLVDMSGGRDLDGIGAAFMPAKTAASGFATALDEATRRLGAFPGAGGGGTALGARDAVGPFSPAPFTGSVGAVSANERRMVDMLVGAGFTNRAADAGFVGGMAGESGMSLDPLARNASGHRGIAQWESSRFAGASAFGDPDSFMTQAKLLIAELKTSESAAGAALRGATTIQGGLAANLRFERPAQDEIASSYAKRLANGTAIGADLAGMTPRDAAPITTLPALTVRGARGAVSDGGPVLPSDAPLGVKLDTAGYIDQWTRDKERAATVNATDLPINRANTDLQNQIALLDTQRDMFGKSAAAIQGAVEAQKLWNSLAANSAAPTGELSKQMGGLADQVRLYGSEMEKVAQRQEDQARMQGLVQGGIDNTRSGISSVLSSGLTSAAHGQGFTKGAGSALASFGDSLLSKGSSLLVSSLLGPQGASFGGLFGSLFGGGGGAPLANLGQGGIGHFASGTQNAPGGIAVVGEAGPELVDMPRGAQVLTADQTSGLMGQSRPAPNVTVGGHSIVVQGNADKDTIAMFDQKLAAANEQQYQRIIRELPQIQRDSLQGN